MNRLVIPVGNKIGKYKKLETLNILRLERIRNKMRKWFALLDVAWRRVKRTPSKILRSATEE
jgi:hypothetical protein